MKVLYAKSLFMGSSAQFASTTANICFRSKDEKLQKYVSDLSLRLKFKLQLFHTCVKPLVAHLALLHAQVPPLCLAHEVGLGHQLGQVLGQHHVAVLELVVVVLVGVVDVLVRHLEREKN